MGVGCEGDWVSLHLYLMSFFHFRIILSYLNQKLILMHYKSETYCHNKLIYRQIDINMTSEESEYREFEL